MSDTRRNSNTKTPKKHRRKGRKTSEHDFILDENAPRHRAKVTRHHLAYELLESNHPELAREMARNLTARALRIMRTRPAPRINAPSAS